MKIIEGHALDLLESDPFLVAGVDLLVTDPPYAFGGSGGEHALSATVATVLRESARRMKPGAWAVIFAASSWRSTAYMIEATRGILEPVRFGTWAKPAAKSRVRTPGWAWATVNVIVMRRPGVARGNPSTELDYIVEPPLTIGRRAQLPPAVARWAVTPFITEGGLAFDPFAGTGALLQAAEDAGMDGLGFELSP